MKIKKLVSVVLAIIMIVMTFAIAIPASAATPYSPPGGTYITQAVKGVTVRSGPGTSYGITGRLAKGCTVRYDKCVKSGGYTWYHITSVNVVGSLSWGTYIYNWVSNAK